MNPRKKLKPVRSYRGESGEQRRAARRARLLEAGLKCFGSKGFRATTVRDVCAGAELTERYFYESFANREALFAEVYQAWYRPMHAAIRAAMEAAPRAELARGRAGLHAFFAFLHANPLAARVLMIEILEVSGGASEQWHTAVADSIDLLRPIAIEVFQPARHPEIDWDTLSSGLIGANIFMATRWILDGFRLPVDAVVDTCMTLYQALADRLAATR